MLKINPDPTFTAVVEVTVPGQDKPEKLKLSFKYRGKKEIVEFFKNNEGRKETDVFMDIVAGWDGAVEAEYTKENVESFLNNYPAAASDIILGYSKLCMASRVKN